MGEPYEKKQINYVLNYLKENKINRFFDIGANIGLYSLSVGKVLSQQLDVVAIEAQLENYNQLCGNININHLDREIRAFNFSASNKEDTMTFLKNVGTSTGTSRIKDTAP